MNTSLLIPLAGAFTGFFVGLTGIGGGALMTPILLLFFGISPKVAIATDLWFATITKAFASTVHGRKKQIDWEIIKYLWIGSLPAALIFSQLVSSHYIEIRQIQILVPAVAVMILITAVSLIFSGQLEPRNITKKHEPSLLPKKRTVFVGFFLGSIVSMTSIGAGALGTVLLLYLYPNRLNTQRIIGTDIAHAIPLAFIAGVVYFADGDIDFQLLTSLLIGSIPGAILGSLTSKYISTRYLKLSLSGLLFVSGIKLII